MVKVKLPDDFLDRVRDRYRVYAVKDGEPLVCLASSPDPGGLGTALVTLHADAKEAGRRLYDEGRIGVYDARPDEPTGEWIVLPWPRGTP